MSVGMVLGSTEETMRVISNPSDNYANFGRGAHTDYLFTDLNSVCITKEISLSLGNSYRNYFYHDVFDILVRLYNYNGVG